MKAGFDLALTVARFIEENPEAEALVLMNHGLVTWADDRQNLVFQNGRTGNARRGVPAGESRAVVHLNSAELETARDRYRRLAPVVRGALALRTSNPDWPFDRFVLRPLISDDVLELLRTEKGPSLALTAPLTPDHLIRTKNYPLLVSPTGPTTPTRKVFDRG